MLKRIVDLIRQKNRARLARRQAARAAGEAPGGWFAQTVARLRAKNRVRLARRRANRQVLASLAANDTALLEAAVFLLKAIRQEQQARADAEEALARRLAGMEDRVDAGVRLLVARLGALEARLPGAALPTEGATLAAGARPAPAGGVNGDLRHGRAPSSAVADRSEAADRTDGEPGAHHRA